MGQKVNPHGLRVGVIKDWDSRWYAREDKVGDLVVEDYNIRKYLKSTLYSAGIAKIEIERDNAKVKISIHCSRPGVIIGKGGTEIEVLRKKIEAKLGKTVALNIVEVRSPDLNDVQVHALAQASLYVLAQSLDLGTGLADDDAGTGAVDVDLDLAVGTLDLDLSYASGVQLVLQILTDVVILDDQVAHLVLTGIPAGVPILDYTNTQSMGINFLSHSYLLIKPSRSHRW